MLMIKNKVKCNNRNCGWQGKSDELLRAPNPFDPDPDDELIGCPKCKDIGSLVSVCDEDDCWLDSSCGTPSKDGYRNTCYDHIPKETNVK